MIGIQLNVHMEQSNKEKEYSFQILTSIMFIVGWIWLYMSSFSFWENNWIYLALYGAIMGVILVILQNSRWDKYLFPTGSLIGLLIFLSGFTYVRNGILQHINEILTFMTGWHGRIYLDYPVESGNGLWLTSLLLVFLLALFVTIAIHKGKLWIMILLILPGVFSYIIGFLQADISWLLLFGAFALLVYRKNQNLDKMNLFSTSSSILLLLICLGLAVGLSSLLPDVSTDRLQTTIQNIIHTWRYDDDLMSMPQGYLSNLGGWDNDETIALEIEMENPEKLYVRGLVGQVYTGTTWEDYRPATRIEGENLFYWLHKADYYGQESIGNALTSLQELESSEMIITNKTASQYYQYLPYALAETDTLDSQVIGDGTSYANEKKQTIQYYPGSVPVWYEAGFALAENQNQDAIANHLKQEQSYREFVYDNNLQLTNASVGVSQRLLGESTESKNLSEIQELIRTTLDSTLTYNDFATTRNGNNDFYQYTMEQSKRGYSVHYATAATLMFRYLGVPARYVEGYFLSADEANSYEEDDTILLTDAHSHAWTEYYLDGIGWIPFEVTPGYIDEEEITALAAALENERGDSAGAERQYNQNQLQYTPPKQLENQEEVSDVDHRFRLEAKHIISVLLFFLLTIIAAAIIYVFMRRKKLFNSLEQIHQMNNRNAITALFAYANMLMEKADIQELDGLDDIRKTNQKAMFSNHEMTDSQREETELFAVAVINKCREIWSPWKKLWYHYILWLYR